MYRLSGVTTDGEDSANSRSRATSASAPATTLSASSRDTAVSSRADSSTLRAITGIITFSSKLPWVPEKPTVASLPITWAATIMVASQITGLTLPGMIELPGCRSGRCTSASPVRGPEESQRRSFATLNSDTAAARKPPDASTRPSREACAAMWSEASVSTSSPVAARSSATTDPPNPGGAFNPVPTAVPPMGSSASRGRVSRSRAALCSTWVAQPPASWPRVIGTASIRWVRPALTTSRQSAARRRSAAARYSSAGTTSLATASVAARWMVVGKTSLEDWEAFTWSFGWTSAPSARVARVAITSLAFMFEEVPEPVWNTSTGKCSSCCPSATSSAAAAITLAISALSVPSRPFTRAQAALTNPNARICARSSPRPEIGKFSTARCVWARHSASTGTRTSPIVSCSTRKSVMPPVWSDSSRLSGWTRSPEYLNHVPHRQVGEEPPRHAVRQVDAAAGLGAQAAGVEGDAAVGEEHRVRHRGVVELAGQVVLVLPEHPVRAGRGALALFATGDRDRAQHYPAVVDQPGLPGGQPHAGTHVTQAGHALHRFRFRGRRWRRRDEDQRIAPWTGGGGMPWRRSWLDGRRQRGALAQHRLGGGALRGGQVLPRLQHGSGDGAARRDGHNQRRQHQTVDHRHPSRRPGATRASDGHSLHLEDG